MGTPALEAPAHPANLQGDGQLTEEWREEQLLPGKVAYLPWPAL